MNVENPTETLCNMLKSKGIKDVYMDSNVLQLSIDGVSFVIDCFESFGTAFLEVEGIYQEKDSGRVL